MPSSSPTWIVITRDVSRSVRVPESPVVFLSMILDADTGFVRGSAAGTSGPIARAQAIRQALTERAGTVPPGPPGRVLCGRGEVFALTSELTRFLAALPEVSVAISAEAEDIFDSLLGQLAGRHQPENFATPDDWAQLVAFAHQYRKAEPWLRWSDTQRLDLVVRVARVSSRYVAIVLGNEGIQRGLVLYPGAVFPEAEVLGKEDGDEAAVPPGTLMFYLDAPRETLPEFVAKAGRYGWPAGDVLTPSWAEGGSDGAAADLGQTSVRRLGVAIAAVLAFDGQMETSGPMTGEATLPGGVPCSFRISKSADWG